MNQILSRREREKIDAINEQLLRGGSYSETIDHDDTKYANFNVKEERMSDKSTSENTTKEALTKETFKWRTKDKEVTLDEMNVDFKLIALAHAMKLSNNHFEKYNHHQKQANFHHNKTDYFVNLASILEESLLTDHNLEVPSTVQDIKAMRRLINQGILKVTNFDANGKN